MKDKTYNLTTAESLTPLLDSILREIEDRSKILFTLDRQRQQMAREKRETEAARAVIADIAVHKRELRYARQELEELGCALEDAGTLAVRIPGEGESSFLWQPGQPIQTQVPTAA